MFNLRSWWCYKCDSSLRVFSLRTWCHKRDSSLRVFNLRTWCHKHDSSLRLFNLRTWCHKRDSSLRLFNLRTWCHKPDSSLRLFNFSCNKVVTHVTRVPAYVTRVTNHWHRLLKLCQNMFLHILDFSYLGRTSDPHRFHLRNRHFRRNGTRCSHSGPSVRICIGMKLCP